MKGTDYNQLWIHRLMLSDLVRGEAFRKAIEHTVTPDSIVLDMGAGSGILSFFAAAAGAKKVYAVERTNIVGLIQELAKSNNLENRIEIIQSDILQAQLPEKVDVLVSEWLGPFGVDENLLYPLLVTRDRWLKEGGAMLPELVTAWMAPAYDPVLDSDMFFWLSRPYGFNYHAVAHHSANEIRYSQQHLTTENLLSVAQPMWRTDLHTFKATDARQPFQCSLQFRAQREALMNCIVLWFDAEFPGNTVLLCGPSAPRNHWGSTVCPLERVLQVNNSSQIRVDFTCEFDEIPGRSFSSWNIYIDGELHEKHTTRNAIT